MKNIFLFCTQAILKMKTVGSIYPSSPSLAHKMLQGISFESINDIVEVGAGTGPFTTIIKNKLCNGSTLYSFEINAKFAQHLRQTTQAVIIEDDIAKYFVYQQKHEIKCSVVISSLPWTIFSNRKQKELLNVLYDALEPGGDFRTYAYTSGLWLKGAKDFKKLLEAKFGNLEVTNTVWWNMPPAVVYSCKKLSNL